MSMMNRPTRIAGAAAATVAAAALLSGCAGVSASPVGGNLGTPLPPVAGPTTTAAGPAPATSTATQAPCGPQTASIAGDSAAKIAQTMAAELPKGCGFTLTGTLESPAEQVDGAQLEGNATYDSTGDLHFALLDQGVVLDTYMIGGSTYLRLYEE